MNMQLVRDLKVSLLLSSFIRRTTFEGIAVVRNNPKIRKMRWNKWFIDLLPDGIVSEWSWKKFPLRYEVLYIEFWVIFYGGSYWKNGGKEDEVVKQEVEKVTSKLPKMFNVEEIRCIKLDRMASNIQTHITIIFITPRLSRIRWIYGNVMRRRARVYENCKYDKNVSFIAMNMYGPSTWKRYVVSENKCMIFDPLQSMLKKNHWYRKDSSIKWEQLKLCRYYT